MLRPGMQRVTATHQPLKVNLVGQQPTRFRENCTLLGVGVGATRPKAQLQRLPLQPTSPYSCQLPTPEQPQSWRRCPDSRTRYRQNPGRGRTWSKSLLGVMVGEQALADGPWPCHADQNTPPRCRRGELPKRPGPDPRGGNFSLPTPQSLRLTPRTERTQAHCSP